MSLFRFPKNGFQQIAEKITANPNLFKPDDWHTLSNGHEAMGEDEILRPYTAHCLAGWIIAITPRAAAYEMANEFDGEDVDDFANRILKQNGRKPIPKAIFHSEEESMKRILFKRAKEEEYQNILDGISGLN